MRRLTSRRAGLLQHAVTPLHAPFGCRGTADAAQARVRGLVARRVSPIGAVGRGLVAGAVGTAAKDAIGYARSRAGGSQSGPIEYETSAGMTDWEKASAPAKIGRRLVGGVFQRDLGPEWARPMNNIVHWGYGLGWALLYGIVVGSLRPRWQVYGLLFGPLVWASGYVLLPLAKLWKPIWKYDAATLAKGLAEHLVYGLATAAAFRALTRR